MGAELPAGFIPPARFRAGAFLFHGTSNGILLLGAPSFLFLFEKIKKNFKIPCKLKRNLL
jgi:hypothetical protein